MIDEALAHKLNTKWCYKHCAIQQPQDAKWINKCIAMASIQYYHERDRMNQWNSIADNKYFWGVQSGLTAKLYTMSISYM